MRIMKNINTGDLEYAPAISADGLELYFTRASQTSVSIMLATRTSLNDPFGEPLALRQLMGFVEAPSISLDLQELFFHKKVDDTFGIYRAERRTALTEPRPQGSVTKNRKLRQTGSLLPPAPLAGLLDGAKLHILLARRLQSVLPLRSKGNCAILP